MDWRSVQQREKRREMRRSNEGHVEKKKGTVVSVSVCVCVSFRLTLLTPCERDPRRRACRCDRW